MARVILACQAVALAQVAIGVIVAVAVGIDKVGLAIVARRDAAHVLQAQIAVLAVADIHQAVELVLKIQLVMYGHVIVAVATIGVLGAGMDTM